MRLDTLNVKIKANMRAFAHVKRNLHCEVHVAAENKHTLPPFESLDAFWIMPSQRSRRRDKGPLFENITAIIKFVNVQSLFVRAYVKRTGLCVRVCVSACVRLLMRMIATK